MLEPYYALQGDTIMLYQGKKSGFTIVELLIVIVVIGILAAITITSYNGVQRRAQNAQTISAVADWAKIIRAYEVDVGSWPTGSSCLGSDYTYGASGTDVSGYQCRQDSAGYGISLENSFMVTLQKYSQSRPQPSIAATGVNSETNWYRGAYYYATAPPRIDYVLAGSDTSCPVIGGLTINNTMAVGNTRRCITNF